MRRSIKKQGRKVEIRNFLYILFLLVFIGIVGFRMSQSIYFGNWFYGSDGKHVSDSSFTRILRLQYGTTMPPTTLPPTTTSPPTTTTIQCSGNLNGRCELIGGSYGDDADENQVRCAVDCYTAVLLAPKESSPNQDVTIAVAFNDSRYVAGGNASYSLLIDNKVWDASNGCKIANVKVFPPKNQYNAACSWQGLSEPCTSTSVNGYLYVTTQCRMPSNISPGLHTLQITPTIFSKPLKLNPMSTSFVVKYDYSESLSTLIKTIISFLGLS